MQSTRPIRILTPDECWAALDSTTLGRLALRDGDDVDIFPINFAVNRRRIYFRSAPGRKLIELTVDPSVTFEADGILGHDRWSVVIKGTAQRLAADDAIEESGVLRLRSMSPTNKWNYVQITPRFISGRRFKPASD